MIDLTAQPATYPTDVVYSVLGEVFDCVQDTIDASATPPELETSISAVRRHQRHNAADSLSATSRTPRSRS